MAVGLYSAQNNSALDLDVPYAWSLKNNGVDLRMPEQVDVMYRRARLSDDDDLRADETPEHIQWIWAINGKRGLRRLLKKHPYVTKLDRIRAK